MAEEEFKISKKEADQLKEALKKPEFCKLLSEYAQEISDPENKKKYEEELIALEKQRGVDMKYIHPKPGFVIKAFLKPEGTRKIFINMCSSDVLDPATSRPSSGRSKRGRGDHWNIPYSLSPLREDLDKAKNKCTVVDVMFHTGIFKRAMEEARFKQLLIDSALEGLEKQLQLVVDRSNIIHLKMSYKGVPSPAVIRTRIQDHQGQEKNGSNVLNIPYPPLPEEVASGAAPNVLPKSEVAKKSKNKEKQKAPMEPRYTVVHCGEFSMQDYTNDRHSTLVKRPRELLVKVEVPGVSSAAKLDVEVFEKRVVLQCKSPCYELDIALAYPVDEEHSSAKFDKSTHVLVLTLPVLPPKIEFLQAPPSPTSGPVTCDTTTEVDDPVNRVESRTNEGEILVSAGDELLHTQPPSSVTSVCPPGDPQLTSGVLKSSAEDGDSAGVAAGISQSGQSDQGADESAYVASADQVGGVADWSSYTKGRACPPFSYRQDGDVVVFCLHTSGVKDGSLVKVFDNTSVQLTYSTSTTFYSFYVSFPDGCLLDVDDCSVDISQDNVVLVLKKDDAAENSQCDWEKCHVGPDTVHTIEKLFLTESNVQNVVHTLPDPWEQTKWSEEAKVAASLAADGEELTLTISDPANTGEGPMQPAAAAATSCDSMVKGQHSATSEPAGEKDGNDSGAGDKGHSELLRGKAALEVQPELNAKQDQLVVMCVDGASGNVASTTALTSESVKVEADGSVFIQADENYMQERHKILATVHSQKDPQPPAGQLKLSNNLLFSLD